MKSLLPACRLFSGVRALVYSVDVLPPLHLRTIHCLYGIEGHHVVGNSKPNALSLMALTRRQVPAELVKMAEDFKKKVEKGEAKWASSGFSGKGFTFDDSEQSESQQVCGRS